MAALAQKDAGQAADMVISETETIEYGAAPQIERPPADFSDLTSRYGLSNGLLRAENNPMGYYASTWAVYQYLTAARIAQFLPGGESAADDFQRRLNALLQNYTLPLPYGLPDAIAQGPAALHEPSDAPTDDDSLWAATCLNLDNPPQLQMAKDIFSLIESQADYDRGIGAWWAVHMDGVRTGSSKAVVSNAPAVVLGVEIYKKTGDQFYLNQSKAIYKWIQHTLKNPENDLYYDRVEVKKPRQLVSRVYTYGPAMVAAANASLHSVDPNAYPLEDSVSLLQRTIRYADKHHVWGLPELDSIFFRVGLQIASLNNDPAFTNQVLNALDRAIAVEPSDPPKLTQVAANLTLRELKALPRAAYGKLGIMLQG